MKKTVILLVLTLFSIALFAQNGVKWETTSFEEVLIKAKNNKKGSKIVFMDCYTTWCGPCKHMANVVFPTKEAGDYFNKNFVNFKCDMEKGEGIELAKKYNIRAYPTFLILDADGNEIGRLLGSGELKEFIERVEKAKDPANNVNNILKRYKETKDTKYAYDYLKQVTDLYMTNEIVNFFDENIDSLKYEKYSQEMWIYLSNAISLDRPKVLNDILSNKFSYNNRIGKGTVDKALLSAYKNGIVSYLSGKTAPSVEVVAKACDGMTLLIDDNYFDNLLLRATKAYMDNNVKDLNYIFHARSIAYTCSPREAGTALSIYTSFKNVSDADKAKFIKDFRSAMEMMLKESDKLAEKYKSKEENK